MDGVGRSFSNSTQGRSADVSRRATGRPAEAEELEEERDDALVAAGGDDPPPRRPGRETATPELFRRVFDVNVLGVINVMAAAVPYMSPGSAIVNFASIDGFAVSPGQFVYGASKAAVIMLTKAAALELAPRGIRVNAVAPGWVATPGTAATNRIAEAVASIPLGRVAEPAEIAEWVWILTGSGAADYMTGETVSLAGGVVLR